MIFFIGERVSSKGLSPREKVIFAGEIASENRLVWYIIHLTLSASRPRLALCFPMKYISFPGKMCLLPTESLLFSEGDCMYGTVFLFDRFVKDYFLIRII